MSLKITAAAAIEIIKPKYQFNLLIVSARLILLKQLIAVSHPDHNFSFS